MTDLRGWTRGLSALAVVTMVAGVLIGRALLHEDGTDTQTLAQGHPILFGAPRRCSGDARPARRAGRAEQQARLHAERYPYDPRDGVQAALLFQEARSCYQKAGLSEHAKRAEALASSLTARVRVDYASSRLVLDNALASEKWAVALVELHRLLRLTEHVRDHAYVEYLRSILGKVTIRANDAS